MGRLFTIAQVSMLGLFLIAAPSAENLEGTSSSQPPTGKLIAYEKPITPAQLHAMTQPVKFDSTTLSLNTDTSTHWVMLNRSDRHFANYHKVETPNLSSTGLLSDAGGLIETASAAKLDDVSIHGTPQAGGGYQPPIGSYAVNSQADTAMDWNQVILMAMQVPEPSTYLLFAGFLTVAALIKRHRKIDIA